MKDLEESGARGFSMGGGEWPLRGFVVRSGREVRGFVNRCPHAGHPLDLQPHHFLTPDQTLIVCSSHGALFEKESGQCLAGPCPGRQLKSVPLTVVGDVVLIAADVDLAALTSQ